MQVVIFDRSLSTAGRWSHICERYQLSLSVHHTISDLILVAVPKSRILIFDQSVLGMDRSINAAMYRNLPQDAIAVTCPNAAVQYVVDHMRMGATWVFSNDADVGGLESGILSLLEQAEQLDTIYQEHLALQAKFTTVSPTESRVLNFVLEGMKNKEIAKALDVSIRTVESRRANAYRKLGVHNLASMVRCVDRAAFLREQFSTDAISRVYRLGKEAVLDFQYASLHQAGDPRSC